jgi:hypothetical protein
VSAGALLCQAHFGTRRAAIWEAINSPSRGHVKIFRARGYARHIERLRRPQAARVTVARDASDRVTVIDRLRLRSRSKPAAGVDGRSAHSRMDIMRCASPTVPEQHGDALRFTLAA